MRHSYGWRRDHLDWRDRFLYPRPEMVQRVTLPAAADLRGSLMPPVYDQLTLGSCVWNACPAAKDFERRKQGEQWEFPSRLWGYQVTQLAEGSPIGSDGGCEIRDAIKVLVGQGVPPESEWPYDTSQIGTPPPQQTYSDAAKYKLLQYSRVTQEPTGYFVRHCLAILGRPIVVGISCFPEIQSDEVAATGDLPMPSPGESPEGGHAILLVGYDDSAQRFKWRNSWGTGWGVQGYGTIPYQYILDPNLASDFWTMLAEE